MKNEVPKNHRWFFFLILAKAFIGKPVVDSNGMIHEPFFLIPIGYLFLVSGVIGLLIVWTKKMKK
ncbi:DUF3955 domain-containing protein [Lysinibacillus xylanilyticus]|nr:DUF3955 domain-containing protein [Lysinibacillus xylanilyticus]